MLQVDSAYKQNRDEKKKKKKILLKNWGVLSNVKLARPGRRPSIWLDEHKW